MIGKEISKNIEEKHEETLQSSYCKEQAQAINNETYDIRKGHNS